MVHYTAAGSGRPVVLMHGLSGSTRWWHKNIDALSGKFRVYALDLVGFGSSRGLFSLERAVDLTAAWLERLDGEPAHLVGHSMGGLIAAQLAASTPARVDGLVLVDAVAVPLRRSMVNSAFRLPPAMRYMPLDFLPVLLTDALRAGPLNLLRASLAIHRADITRELGQINSRTLVVWGEHDKLLPLALGERLHRSLPGSRWVVVPGAGHNPMWDRPDTFNQLVADFISPQA
jgi:pimeloyl-ACP methyl ester carboxylesterase